MNMEQKYLEEEKEKEQNGKMDIDWEPKSMENWKTIEQEKERIDEREEEYGLKTDLKKDYWKYAMGCLIYALFFVFCFYKNVMGITAPFFSVGTIFFLGAAARKQKLAYQKKSAVIIAAIVLLGLSNCLTANGGIIFFNDIFSIFLILLLIVIYLYDTKGWSFWDYLVKLSAYLAEGIGSVADVFTNYIEYRQSYVTKERKKSFKNPQVRAALLGLILACPVVFIVIIILATSDIVFEYMIGNIIESIYDLKIIGNVFWIVFMAVMMYFIAYGLLSQFVKKYGKEEKLLDIQKQEPMAAITFSGILLVVYMIYSCVQIGALFLGKMTLPEGYTYSQYAREGFIQLLFVCILNFGIVMVCYSFFRESKILKSILALMTVCTFIMIASASFRMGMYVQAYGLTRKRVLVFWLLFVLFLLFLGVLAAIWREGFPLFQYGTATVVGMYLLLSFSHMDYWIARYDLFVNIGSTAITSTTQSVIGDNQSEINREDYGFAKENVNNYEETAAKQKQIYRYGENSSWRSVNITYLETELSLDAAPAILEYYEKENTTQKVEMEYYLSRIEKNYKAMGIRSFNVSKYIAYREKIKW